MATRKTSPSVEKQALKMAPAIVQRPAPCSKTFEFFKDVTIGPGESHDSTTPKIVDCFQWLHVWVLARHPRSLAMDNIRVQLVFELPGKMGATGLANLEIDQAANPTPLGVTSGGSAGGYGGFVIRSPIIGPGVRAIVINNGAQTYDFTLWGYCTR